jgi:two-component system response regulator HydG
MTKGQVAHLAVVDDDQDTLDMISAYFRPKGFKVDLYSDVESAFEVIGQAGDDWDVLLTDFHFANMSGAEFLSLVKKKLPELPIISIAPAEQASAAIESIGSGAYDYVLKPLQFAQLHLSVDRAIEHRRLKKNNAELRNLVKVGPVSQTRVVGRSSKFLATLDVSKRVAKSSASVLITGESGTGKEMIARFIHEQSPQCQGPFVAINCSAIPEHLLESELFGHAKGSFTGAQEKRMGLFEEAQGGILFLDEIGDLKLSLQAKLLRVLQEKKIRRVGENVDRPISCRIISATHQDLVAEVQEGRFREDLFFRLNVIPIVVPPLRERQDDILLLAETFLKKYALENNSLVRSISKDARRFLLDNPWRGNVRELENAIERAVVLCPGAELSLEDFLPLSKGLNTMTPSVGVLAEENVFFVRYLNELPRLDEIIDRYIEFAVKKRNGARDLTAKEIGIDRKTLYKRLRVETHAVV